ncbi:MAG TPA: hypothetical protein PLT91_06205 [Clostridia bacterium]|nr:MAG: hypothetical protein BWX97_02302 [Firmicutes bacterium ADurb.Bin146]HOD92680.1 hypothetical protein [Clostridia bacterium]HQM39816.1 hypothetical protein [Clostridia bacterium]
MTEDKRIKEYVNVTVKFKKDGQMIPVNIEWENGKVYTVDRVLDIRNAASLKAGGCGIRYLCKIMGMQTYIFFEEDKWFVERKMPCAEDS